MSPYALYRKPAAEVIFQRDPSARQQVALEQGERVVRDTNLRREDFNKHGMIVIGCPRCGWAIRHGWDVEPTLSHSVECRERLREAIRSSGQAGRARVEAREARKNNAEAQTSTSPAEGGGFKI